MFRYVPSALALLTTLALGASPTRASTWEVDDTHSATSFTVRHMMVSNLRGEFGKITGTVNLDDKDISKSSVEITVDVNSINTRNAERDTHLKSPEFFDAAKFPTVTFKSTKVTQAGGGKLKLTGDLTLHGVKKTVTFDVEGPSPEVKDPWGNVKRGATATAKINRKEFGLSWNKTLEAGGVLIADEVTLSIDLEMNKKK